MFPFALFFFPSMSRMEILVFNNVPQESEWLHDRNILRKNTLNEPKLYLQYKKSSENRLILIVTNYRHVTH